MTTIPETPPLVRRVRKRPVEVAAAHWDGTALGATPIIDWVLASGGTARYWCDTYGASARVEASDDCGPHVIRIHTLEGPMTAAPGWWVIRGVAGEFYGCAGDIFDRTYDVIEDDDRPSTSALAPAEVLLAEIVDDPDAYVAKIRAARR